MYSGRFGVQILYEFNQPKGATDYASNLYKSLAWQCFSSAYRYMLDLMKCLYACGSGKGIKFGIISQLFWLEGDIYSLESVFLAVFLFIS